MILAVHACPNCGGSSFAIEVKTWVNVDGADDNSAEHPRFDGAEFDQEDAEYAEPIDGGSIICRDCQAMFQNVEAPTVFAATEGLP